ncbi:hypothetical protein [Solidesulfovibrio sp.]|uniref:ORC-CDC6 family AAA ATPase n=1 Tax=Solidesulfovibrio sp. TaxID=2910990 RepID=UPI00262C3514|nr:hypothetical protein [Solidesulfovibrio sp.]
MVPRGGDETSFLLRDKVFNRAVSNILQRSERQRDADKLVDIYVDVGIVPQLENNNNQIIYGRRGTGKTHIFKVLQKKFEEEEGTSAIYIDCRVLGSTAQFSDDTYPMSVRCLALFRDFMTIVHNELLNLITHSSSADAEKVFDLLYRLSNAFSVDREKIVKEEMVVVEKNKLAYSAGLEGSFDLAGGALKPTLGGAAESGKDVTERFKINLADKVIFGDIHYYVKEILSILQYKLVLLVDEWSSLPLDIQPYFSEFIKRSFFANELVVVKIASLEYRSEFNVSFKGGILGFEPGADISIALDIDDYYVYDRNPDQISNLFLDIIYRHIKSELPQGYFETIKGIHSSRMFAWDVFTTDKVYNELARAAEGVVRDLINIFTNAFFDTVRRSRDRIDQRSILEAARGWFEKDKNEALDIPLRDLLSKIINEVIGHRSARSFLLPNELQKHPSIQKLFDLRVLHLVQRGYADKDNPGKRYNIYTLDYGTYVDLLKTSRQPRDYVAIENSNDGDWIVPFDDKRRIRRIVLTSEFIDGNV